MINIYIDVDISQDGKKFRAHCSTPFEQNVVIPVDADTPAEALEGMLDLMKIGVRHSGGDLSNYIQDVIKKDWTR
jgi:hypothetical protein